VIWPDAHDVIELPVPGGAAVALAWVKGCGLYPCGLV